MGLRSRQSRSAAAAPTSARPRAGALAARRRSTRLRRAQQCIIGLTRPAGAAARAAVTSRCLRVASARSARRFSAWSRRADVPQRVRSLRCWMPANAGERNDMRCCAPSFAFCGRGKNGAGLWGEDETLDVVRMAPPDGGGRPLITITARRRADGESPGYHWDAGGRQLTLATSTHAGQLPASRACPAADGSSARIPRLLRRPSSPAAAPGAADAASWRPVRVFA